MSALLLSASVTPAPPGGDDAWVGIVVIACIGLVICSVAIGVVVRIEHSEGLDDDLDRE